jgi:hypothetical protein
MKVLEHFSISRAKERSEISPFHCHDSIHETTVLEWKIDADILKDRSFRVKELRADSGDLSFNIHGNIRSHRPKGRRGPRPLCEQPVRG